MEGEILLAFCDKKKLSVAKTRFKKNDERKITNRSGGNRTDIDFVLVGRNDGKYLKNIKALPGYLQHALVSADINTRKLKSNGNNKVVKRVWKLKNKDVRSNFQLKDGEQIDR